MFSFALLVLGVAASPSAWSETFSPGASVVQLQLSDSGRTRIEHATAFVVGVDDAQRVTVATAAHSLADFDLVRVYRRDQSEGRAVNRDLNVAEMSVATDAGLDLALIRFQLDGSTELRPVSLLDPIWGDEPGGSVRTWGFPRSNRWSLPGMQGHVISRLSGSERGRLFGAEFRGEVATVTGEPTAHGMSGGPVVQRGNVVGMHLGRIADYSGLVLSAGDVIDALKGAKFRPWSEVQPHLIPLRSVAGVAWQKSKTDPILDRVTWDSFDVLERALGGEHSFQGLFQEIDLTPHVGRCEESMTLIPRDATGAVAKGISISWNGLDLPRNDDGTFSIAAADLEGGEQLILVQMESGSSTPQIGELFVGRELHLEVSVDGQAMLRIERSLPRVFGDYDLFLRYRNPAPATWIDPAFEVEFDLVELLGSLGTNERQVRIRPGANRPTFGQAELSLRLAHDEDLAARLASTEWGPMLRARPQESVHVKAIGEQAVDVLAMVRLSVDEQVVLRRFGVAVELGLPDEMALGVVVRVQVVRRRDGTLCVYQRLLQLFGEVNAPIDLGEDAMMRFDVGGLLRQGMLAWGNNAHLHPDDPKEVAVDGALEDLAKLFKLPDRDDARIAVRFEVDSSGAKLVASIGVPSATEPIRDTPISGEPQGGVRVSVLRSGCSAWAASHPPGWLRYLTRGNARAELRFSALASGGPIVGEGEVFPEGFLSGLIDPVVARLLDSPKLDLVVDGFGAKEAIRLTVEPESEGALRIDGRVDQSVLLAELRRLIEKEAAKESKESGTQLDSFGVGLDGDQLVVTGSVTRRKREVIGPKIPEVKVAGKVIVKASDGVVINYRLSGKLRAGFLLAAVDGVAAVTYGGFDVDRDLLDPSISKVEIPRNAKDLLGPILRPSAQKLGERFAQEAQDLLRKEVARVCGPCEIRECGLSSSGLRFSLVIR